MRILNEYSTRAIVYAALGGFLTITAPVTVQGQVPAPMPCITAANFLTINTGTRTDLFLASSCIVRCDNAVRTLIGALRIAMPNSLRDTTVQQAAWLLSDRRMLDSVTALSRDPSVTVERRTVALALLTHYADSLASLWPGGLNDPVGTVIATRIEGGYLPGGVPLTATDQSTALQSIAWMREHESDPTLKSLAQRAYDQLVFRRSQWHLGAPRQKQNRKTRGRVYAGSQAIAA